MDDREPKFKKGDRVYLEDNPNQSWYEEHGTVIQHLGSGLYEIEADRAGSNGGPRYREWDDIQMRREPPLFQEAACDTVAEYDFYYPSVRLVGYAWDDILRILREAESEWAPELEGALKEAIAGSGFDPGREGTWPTASCCGSSDPR